MPRRLAQQRMTLSDLGWPFHIIRIARYLCDSSASCIVTVAGRRFTAFSLVINGEMFPVSEKQFYIVAKATFYLNKLLVPQLLLYV